MILIGSVINDAYSKFIVTNKIRNTFIEMKQFRRIKLRKPLVSSADTGFWGSVHLL